MFSSRVSRFRASLGISGVLAVLASSAGLLALTSGTANAQAYLVGFELFSPDATGNNNGSGYVITTNDTSGFARVALSLNGGTEQITAISFALSQGSNAFTFQTQGDFPTNPVGVNLFFNSTGDSFNPATGADVAGDLSVVAPTDSSGTFSFIAAGTPVLNYDTSSPNVDAPYSGATFYDVGGQRVTLTQFSSDTTPNGSFPSGSFTLTVGPQAVGAPEPGTVALLGTGLVPLAGVVVRRKRRLVKTAA